MKKLILLFFIAHLTMSLVNGQNCVSRFTYNSNELTVNFIDSSSPFLGSTKHFWEFGDSAFSTLRNPTHVFEDAGIHLVCLSVRDSAFNCLDTSCDTLYLNTPCQASFNYSVDSNNLVSFNNFTSPKKGYRFLWDFGDSSPSDTSENPNHQYPNSNFYVVTLTAIGNGVSCSVSDTIYVNHCRAEFTSKDSLGSIYFTNTSFTSSFVDFYWDFGDSSFSTQKNPIHSYSQPGTYSVILTLYDSLWNCTSTFQDSVVVSPPPCIAYFTYQTVDDTLFITDSSANRSNLSYDFGDGITTTSQNPVHIYAQSGTYNVCQTVTDSVTNCTAVFCDSVVINVPDPCQAGFTFSQLDDTLIITNTASSFTSVLYDFGDGTTSTDLNPKHVYQQSGTYLVKQYVLNNLRFCEDSIQQLISINVSGSCEAFYDVAIDTTIKNTLFLINQSSDMMSHHYRWTFGDGNTGQGRTFSHHYLENGKYEICLFITDTVLNCTSSYCDSVGLDSNDNVLKSLGFFLQIIDGKEVGINEVQKNALNALVYPNPFNESITVEINAEFLGANYRIYNLQGKVLREEILNSRQIEIETSDLSKGIYFLQIFNSEGSTINKLIKQ